MKQLNCVKKIYAPDLDPRIRHPKILETFDNLNVGESFELSNNHDPKPLHYQFMIEREGTFTWEYLQDGPDMWRVLIGKI